MATLAAQRWMQQHPFALASFSALIASSAYATIVENEAESREARYNNLHNLGTKANAVHVSRMQNSERKFHVETIDCVTQIIENPEIVAAPSPPPTLPRMYNCDAIEEYWSARPVTVVRRLADIATELSPLLWACIRDFKLESSLNNVNEKDKRSHDETSALQKQHARALRDALTRLGPAFIKMGQQLSIRPDLVPPPVLAELQQLCDSVEPVPDEVAMDLLMEELGCKSRAELSEIFTDLHRVAAASLGQVYKATVKDTGHTVAIKVQRPDMVKRLSLDLFLLQWYGRIMDIICGVLTEQIPYHSNFVNAFAMGSYMELDYENEASNQLRFKTELEKRRCNVTVPDVFVQYTTRRVIVTEWINGMKLVDAPRDQIRELIPVGVELFLTQLLDIGAFHADPHPANLYVTNGGKLCLLDFGLCAEIDEGLRHAMTAAIVNLLAGDFHSLIATDAKKLGFLPEDMDVTELKPILTKILTEGLLESGSNLHDRKRKLMDISNELNEVFFKYPFSVPPFFALITRGLGLLEGIALSGDPDFDIFKASLPYATKRAIDLFGISFLASSGMKKLQRRRTVEQ